MTKRLNLRRKFPFHNEFRKFLQEYKDCYTYWYIPKARSLKDKPQVINDIKRSLSVIFDCFLEEIWNHDTQDKLLSKMREENILSPYVEGDKVNRTALTRIHKVLWETLGLVWIEDNKEIIITDAGLDLLSNSDQIELFKIIEGQIAKWQYPNLNLDKGFSGILPHLFLIQVLQQLDYKISHEEFDLFINLATSQNDLHRITAYIKYWRELNIDEQKELIAIIKEIPMQNPPEDQGSLFDDEPELGNDRQTRYKKIHQDSSYQRAFYCFPYYLKDEDQFIFSVSKNEIDTLIKDKLSDLKISIFRNKADWFAYYGNPEQKPSWFTYLSLAVEHADSKQEAERIIQEAGQKLETQDADEIKQKQLEKGIEDFYVKNLYQIESGLKLVDNGQKEGRNFQHQLVL
jgi:hypothetical protein